ncbi:MAG: sugar phosphate isomerase/epimerase [Cyclobacteriaceae bacterium]|nr:sugar phosphate isomerase/epimerase [Cyclobacteriaceae bacterium]
MNTTRRKFIINSGLAAAGAFVLPACTSGTSTSSAGELAQEAVSETKKKVGLQLYTLRNEINVDLPGTIKQVADTGYNYLELFGYGNRSYFGMPAAEFYQLIKDNGLEARSSHHGSGVLNNEVQGSLSNGWEQAVEDAASAGQQFMALAYLQEGERDTLDKYKKLTELLNKAGQVCKDAGIQFCYHNHAFEFEELEGEIPMYHILDNTDPELVKMELDIYWITRAGFNTLEFFDKYPGRVPLWHVKDMDNTPEQKFAEVGTGVIDFNSIFAQAEKAGMKSFFVEQDVSQAPIESIKLSYKNIQSIG